MTYTNRTRTFLDDLPGDVRAAYKIVGNQPTYALRNMVVAIGLTPSWEQSGNRWDETQERLDAVKLILAYRRRTR